MIGTAFLGAVVRRGWLPLHLGVVVDGNRRWALGRGLEAAEGHRAGARHIEDLLRWCEELGVRHVTVYVLSLDTLRHRGPAEVALLEELLATVLPDTVLARAGRWQLHLAGDLTVLPERTRAALQGAASATDGAASHVTFAVGYDGREDIVQAVRTAVHRMPEGGTLAVEDITRCLSGGPVKDIDLVVRTGGESRLPGFFPWQSVGTHVHRCAKPWPAFGRLDLLRALAGYASARRRGSA